MTRDDLFNINAGIVKGLCTAIAKHCPNVSSRPLATVDLQLRWKFQDWLLDWYSTFGNWNGRWLDLVQI
jgi:hypothetical protein